MYTTPRHAASGDLAPDLETTSFRLKLAAVPRRLTTTTGRRRRRPGSRQVRMRTQTRGHWRVGRRAREVAGAGEEPPGAGCRRSGVGPPWAHACAGVGGLGAAAAMKRRRAGCIGKSRGNAGVGAGTGINLVKFGKLSVYLPLLKIATYCIPLSGGIIHHKSAHP
jgi:hypothetical protein